MGCKNIANCTRGYNKDTCYHCSSYCLDTYSNTIPINILNPTMKETYDRERGMIFPSDMSECTLAAISHHNNILYALSKCIPAKYKLKNGSAYCPYCENLLLEESLLPQAPYEGDAFCGYCGQAIDWNL